MESMEQVSGMLSDSADIANAIVALVQLGITGVGLVVTVIGAIVAVLIALACYILHAIPVYKLAKKTKCKLAWLAWIPIFDSYFRLYVLADMAGNKPFTLFNGKLKLENRRIAFWIWLGITLIGGFVVSVVSPVLGGILGVIPVIGTLIAYLMGYALGLLPQLVCAFAEFAFLRDVLDIFKENKKSNITAAIVITLVDELLTGGWARTVWLYTLLKCKPLPQTEPVVDATP